MLTRINDPRVNFEQVQSMIWRSSLELGSSTARVEAGRIDSAGLGLFSSVSIDPLASEARLISELDGSWSGAVTRS